MLATHTSTPSRVAEARRQAGLTQTELAQRAGLSRSTVARMEAGRQSPAVEVAIAIASALGETVEALFGPGDD